MPDEKQKFSLIHYIEIAWRRKWFLLTPLFVGIPTAIFLCFFLPKIYKATTTILVVPQNVPDEFIKSTVTMNPSEYLTVISQEILSRTRLEQVIKQMSPDLLNKLPVDTLIATMRQNIDIDVKRRRDRGVASFSLSYVDRDPFIAAEATNLMANLFIEETGEDFRDILDYNPLPASFAVTVNKDFSHPDSLEYIIADLNKFSWTEEVV